MTSYTPAINNFVNSIAGHQARCLALHLLNHEDFSLADIKAVIDPDYEITFNEYQELTQFKPIIRTSRMRDMKRKGN